MMTESLSVLTLDAAITAWGLDPETYGDDFQATSLADLGRR